VTRPHHFRGGQLPRIELQQRKFALQRRKVPVRLVEDYRIQLRGIDSSPMVTTSGGGSA
jgi:hypothetical protein